MTQPMGSEHPSVLPSQVFPALDGLMMLTAGNDTQFVRPCEAIGRSDLLADPRFLTNEACVWYRDDVRSGLAMILASRTRSEWIERFSEAGVPWGPVNDIAEALADPHVQARGMRVDRRDRDPGVVPVVASPLRFSESDVEHGLPPPRLGEHANEVLEDWLGLDREEIGALRVAGAL